MTMDSFQAGDVVTLKSGSPKMTIKFVENGEAYCQWFAGNEVKGDKFAVTQLVLQKPLPPSERAKIIGMSL